MLVDPANNKSLVVLDTKLVPLDTRRSSVGDLLEAEDAQLVDAFFEQAEKVKSPG